MSKDRLKNINWAPGENGRAPTWERANTAILLDIRDELQKLNRVFECPNFLEIPRVLRAIRRKIPTKPRIRKNNEIK